MINKICLDCGKTFEAHDCQIERKKFCSKLCYSTSQKGKAFRTTHGLTKSRFHNIWLSMKQRCYYEKNDNYKWYGGRGIKVEPQWLDFMVFMNDMYESYLAHVNEFGEKNTTLDRTDNDGNYSKENCEWKTLREQYNKRSFCKFFTYNGKTQTLTEWANELGINKIRLWKRIARGWSFERAITEPKKINGTS